MSIFDKLGDIIPGIAREKAKSALLEHELNAARDDDDMAAFREAAGEHLRGMFPDMDWEGPEVKELLGLLGDAAGDVK